MTLFPRYLLIVLVLYSLTPTLPADEFRFVDLSGEEVTIQAKPIVEKPGMLVIQEPDGRIRMLQNKPQLNRQIKPTPEPYDAKTFAEKLQEKLGSRLIMQEINDPYVINLILMGPIDKRSENQVNAFLAKAGKFFKTAENSFESFMRTMKIDLKKNEFPLAVLIFESDKDFEEHVVKTTSNKGMSAGNIAGFYDPLSNHLVLRITECASFQVPLHESIHQQVFNRGVFQRLAPLPVWFNEGIATGFEGTGEKITGTPAKPHPRYLGILQSPGQISWGELVQYDKPFHGDILAGEAYAHAWSMHWLLANHHQSEYAKYLKILGTKQPLMEDSAASRLEDFRAAFPDSINVLADEYQTKITAIAKRNPQLVQAPVKNRLEGQQNMANVTMDVLMDGATLQIEASGVIKNISPWRSLTFLVTCETDAGTFAQWLIPEVKPNGTAKLPPMSPTIPMLNSRGGGMPRRFSVKIKSALPDDTEAIQWKTGKTPKPVYNG